MGGTNNQKFFRQQATDVHKLRLNQIYKKKNRNCSRKDKSLLWFLKNHRPAASLIPSK